MFACIRACAEGPAPVGDCGELVVGLDTERGVERVVVGDLWGGGGGTDLNRLCTAGG